jgi:uncharacterized protein DUF6883
MTKMKLPHNDRLEIPQRKIINYLLDLTHPDGRGKAIFFLHFGFSVEKWGVLALALRKHGIDHDVSKVENSTFGKRYVIEGVLETPDGRNPQVRSVWFVEKESEVTRFVTAYALEECDDDSGT